MQLATHRQTKPAPFASKSPAAQSHPTWLPIPEVEGTLSLLPGSTLSVAAAPGTVVTVLAGALQMTVHRGGSRHFLPAGAARMADRAEGLQLAGTTGTVVHVARPSAAPTPTTH